jgi:DNA-binding beta-propeller fold protein YncE
MRLHKSMSMGLHTAAALCGVLALVVGCAETPTKPRQATPSARFYPALPDPPRIQHLARFADSRDVGVPRDGIADFVLGAEGSERALSRPYGVALYQGKIYVADSRAPGIAIFDLVARRFSLMEGTGAGRMGRPINITIDADGTKYVADLGRNQVLVYDRTDRFVAAFGDKGQFKPVDAQVIGERLYVADLEHHEVQVLDKQSGKLLFKFGKPGSAEEGALFQPTNLAHGPDGNLCVVETGNFRVSCFTPEGKFLRRFGETGQAPGQFARPKGIAIDRAGRIYVGDAAFQNVQIFDQQGRVLMAFGQPADGSQGLNLPAGISIDYDNVEAFRAYAAPGFNLEYVILVVSQFEPDKVDVFGFGRMTGVNYPPDPEPVVKPGG